jgi:AcrR family transcriptional regulator
MTALPRRQQNKLDRERAILDAALRVFAAQGYSGATTSKDDLFQAMMLAKRDLMLDVFDHPSGFMVADLWDFAWAYADTVMRPDMLSLARLIIGEVTRFPEIGRAYQASGPDHLLHGIMRYLVIQRDAGRLAFDDAELAAQDLWGLILSAPRTQALHMPDALPDRAILHRYISNGLRVFLKAYSTTPAQDLDQLAALCRQEPQ